MYYLTKKETVAKSLLCCSYQVRLVMVVFGRRTTKTFKKLMALVDDLNISVHYTDKLNIYKAFFQLMSMQYPGAADKVDV
jgi:IS1 family transposase